jgi:hypothetical protein
MMLGAASTSAVVDNVDGYAKVDADTELKWKG